MGFWSQFGKVISKPLGLAERVGGGVVGGMTGGPMGALAGYKAGDSLANIEEDALSGRNVRTHLGSNLLGLASGVAGGYGASQLPNNGGIMNIGRNGPSAASGAGGAVAGLGAGVGAGGDGSVPGGSWSTGQVGPSQGGGGVNWGNVAGQVAGAAGGANGQQQGGFWNTPGLVPGLFGLAGSALSGAASGAEGAANRAQQQKQFDTSQIVPQGQAAVLAQQQAQMTPIRDRAAYLLQQRMGTPSQQFVPHDIFNPSYGSGAPQMGGMNQSALNAQAQNYQPGAGGINSNAQQLLLKKLGYG